MREILFREKQTDKDKWIYGMPVKGTVNDESTMLIIDRTFDCGEYACKGCEYTPVILETVGQYTGLTDKNGTKIFEGDIVKIVDFQTGVVVQEDGTFGIGIKPSIDWDYLDSEICTITGCDNKPYFCRNDNFCSFWELMWNYNQEENSCCVAEVIGNIHDNKEEAEKALERSKQ